MTLSSINEKRPFLVAGELVLSWCYDNKLNLTRELVRLSNNELLEAIIITYDYFSN